MIEQAADLGWEIVPLVREGQVRGRAALRGTEIHFEVCKPPAVLRHSAREFLRPLMEREGFLTTRVPVDDSRSKRFVEKLGFEWTWTDTAYDYYMLTKLPWEA